MLYRTLYRPPEENWEVQKNNINYERIFKNPFTNKESREPKITLYRGLGLPEKAI